MLVKIKITLTSYLSSQKTPISDHFPKKDQKLDDTEACHMEQMTSISAGRKRSRDV